MKSNVDEIEKQAYSLEPYDVRSETLRPIPV